MLKEIKKQLSILFEEKKYLHYAAEKVAITKIWLTKKHIIYSLDFWKFMILSELEISKHYKCR